jgi:hypothetical protein
MKIRTSMVSTLRVLFGLSLLGLSLLTGCINTPQTKALLTPVGVIGVHSFGPPRPAPRNTDFDQRVAERTARILNSGANSGAERS